MGPPFLYRFFDQDNGMKSPLKNNIDNYYH